MEIYADYGFYENEYLLGKEAVIVEGLFPYYARVATQEIKNVISLDMVDDNLQATEEMKMATCEIAELLASLDNNSISDADDNKTSVPTGVSSERYTTHRLHAYTLFVSSLNCLYYQMHSIYNYTLCHQIRLLNKVYKRI